MHLIDEEKKTNCAMRRTQTLDFNKSKFWDSTPILTARQIGTYLDKIGSETSERKME